MTDVPFLDPSEPPRISVWYADENNMPYSAIAHEVGHWISFLQGNYTEELINAYLMSNHGIRIPWNRRLIYVEEERATQLGMAYAEGYGLTFTPEDILENERALKTYE
jgi:hypothetical protein